MKKRALLIGALLAGGLAWNGDVRASSHREAPLIANDPLADNTDLYCFRSPDDPNSIIIIANFVVDLLYAVVDPRVRIT